MHTVIQLQLLCEFCSGYAALLLNCWLLFYHSGPRTPFLRLQFSVVAQGTFLSLPKLNRDFCPSRIGSFVALLCGRMFCFRRQMLQSAQPFPPLPYPSMRSASFYRADLVSVRSMWWKQTLRSSTRKRKRPPWCVGMLQDRIAENSRVGVPLQGDAEGGRDSAPLPRETRAEPILAWV